MSSVTPAEVLARRSQLLLNGDADGFAALFAPDAVIETPFAGSAGMPARQEGREAIRESAHRVVALLRVEDFEVSELYQTEDPEVVIAEVRAKGTVTTADRPFTTTSVQILRIRDGRIVLLRDFADPRLLAEITGESREGS
jgi:ketosteroid isomerase-like protein